jgi:hypothetical protein
MLHIFYWIYQLPQIVKIAKRLIRESEITLKFVTLDQ